MDKDKKIKQLEARIAELEGIAVKTPFVVEPGGNLEGYRPGQDIKAVMGNYIDMIVFDAWSINIWSDTTCLTLAINQKTEHPFTLYFSDDIEQE